ncbi:F-box protein At3g07870 [Beta vulgaris subsp. vulgaris]|uniref:F-box protein At3g07870 n=1 Tax=Beta vulgaris subsp. vulgaris TaxID=3555 RepID=UPI00053F7E82|nr:F-box protein At3g07870 [Beta vulgaris subsp. vulgaris]
MSDVFPEELLLQILVRLSVKALLLCRSVCKSWCLLISSSHFINSHIRHNHAVGNHNLLLRCFSNNQEKEIYTLHDEIDSLKTIRELVFPFDKPQGDFFTVVGCVNGLICLWDDTHELNPVTLWNPALQKSFRVPSLHYSMSDDGPLACQKLAFGFGFDALANDYKILRIAFTFAHFIKNRRIDRRPLSFLSKIGVCSADIFSLSTKSWRHINTSVPLQQLSIPVFVNGALHFLTSKDGNQFVVVSFDLNAEAFVEMACPPDAKLGTHLDQRIVASSETISLLHQRHEHLYDIWVMKKYNVAESWIRLFSIDLDMSLGWKRILGFSGNGGLMLVGSGSWVGYPIVNAIQIVDFQPLGSYCAPYAETYMETLALLQDDNTITHLQQNIGGAVQDHKRRGQEIRRVAGKRRGKSARVSLTH